MSAAPSLEELLSGVPKRATEGAGGGGRLGEPPTGTTDGEENVSAARHVTGVTSHCPTRVQLDEVEETVAERLVGLTEMVPERVWDVGEKGFWLSVWLVRRSSWVLGTSLALLALPPFIEQQRLEYEEMQNMQKKQVGHLALNVCICGRVYSALLYSEWVA